MTYQSVWWYPNYIEYGSGLKPPKTWPHVMEQYRRPNALTDLRYYDLPTEEYQAKLYYNLPRLGKPVYRGTFRDKPHTVSRHYPNAWPEGQPPGFHGRVYYEDGPPAFKYEGPKQDKLYWLEREPYLPVMPKSRSGSATGCASATTAGCASATAAAKSDNSSPGVTTNSTYGAYYRPTPPEAPRVAGSGASRPGSGRPNKRVTQDGVGFL